MKVNKYRMQNLQGNKILNVNAVMYYKLQKFFEIFEHLIE